MKKTFMIDIDSTLADTSIPIYNIMKTEFGKDIPIDNWEKYDLSHVFHIDIKHIIDAFVRNHETMISNVPLYDGAREFLEELRKQGEVHIVTARGWFPNGKELTEQYFIDNDLPFDCLQIVGGRELKGKYAKHINAIAAFDDHVDHLYDIKQENENTILVVRDQPWNRHVDEFHRAHEFADFLKHIEGK